MCFGYFPSPGHPERPTSEIGFKPVKWNPYTFLFSLNNALTSHADGNAILLTVSYLHIFCCTSVILSGSLIVSQLSTNLILAIASQSTLSILGLTETWICSEDSTTSAVLSINFPISHTPHQVGRVLVFLFLIIAIMVTAPVKLHIVMIYHLPIHIYNPL